MKEIQETRLRQRGNENKFKLGSLTVVWGKMKRKRKTSKQNRVLRNMLLFSFFFTSEGFISQQLRCL
jgi:hypothetical protein